MFEQYNKNLLHIHNLNEKFKGSTFYLGIDPTGPGIHIGHLIPIKLAMNLMKAGHKAILVVGGFTGAVGDPTEKTTQRQKLDQAYIDENISYIEQDLIKLFKPYCRFKILNNKDWLSELKFSEYLEIAYHISVNRKIKMDTFKKRIETESHLSMAEFSYSDLQMMDFLYLYRNFNCTAQIGGGDQWGNIAFGIDCVKKITKNEEIFGICTPLLTSAGKKVSKSEGKAPYLRDPYLVYDFIRNLPDETAYKLWDFVKDDDSVQENPIELKNFLTKYILDLYHYDEPEIFERIHQENYLKFHGGTESNVEFSIHSPKLLVRLLQNFTDISASEFKRKLKEDAIRINNEIVNENILLNEGRYKISLGKKQHFFVEIIS